MPRTLSNGQLSKATRASEYFVPQKPATLTGQPPERFATGWRNFGTIVRHDDGEYLAINVRHKLD